ncbi:MAG TPA: DUF4255 domain-containing protein [Streptosporangiaceae bacterium]|nr:DUF4255 domain-containing protein [Streptosporangiaceae bacterium]
MIAEADQALAVLLKTKVIGSAGIAIAFDPPNRPWIQALKGPAVNVFLFDIKENVHRRDVMFEKVTNEDGVVVARRSPPPRYDLHYTITAWAPNVLVEHKILGAVVRCFGSMTTLPREVLPPALAALPYEVLVSTGSGPKRGMFINMGGDLKAGLELTITVPVPALPDLPAAPAVQQQPQLAVKPMPGAGPAAASPAENPASRQPAPAPAPAQAPASAKSAPGPGPAPAKSAPGPAPAKSAPAPAPAPAQSAPASAAAQAAKNPAPPQPSPAPGPAQAAESPAPKQPPEASAPAQADAAK